MAGTQVLDLSSAAFAGTNEGILILSEADKIETITQHRMLTSGGRLSHGTVVFAILFWISKPRL